MKARFFIFSAIAIAACSPLEPDEVISDLQKEGAEDGVYTLTVEATKSFATKALELTNGDGTLNAKWATGEKVGVYVDGVRCGQLTATVDGTDPTIATLSGNVTGISQDVTFMLLYPDREDITEGTKWDYTGQDGAAPSGNLGAKYDYATATLTVDSISGTTVNTTSSSVAFQNEQSVYRFGFKVGGSGDPVAVKQFTVTSSQNQLVRTRSYVTDAWTSAFGSLTVTPSSAPSGNLYYVSLRNENTSVNDTYTFYAIGSNDALYSGTKDITAANLGNGKFLSMQSISISQPSFAFVPDTAISEPENVY